MLGAVVLEPNQFSSLTIALVGEGATLGWMPNDTLSFHSVGQGSPNRHLAYYVFGQEVEVQEKEIVPLDVALRAVTAYIETGAPGVPYLLWEQD